MTDGGITPLFRLRGQYDRYGRQLGWLARVAEDGVDVYHLCGRLLGKLVDHHYVLRGPAAPCGQNRSIVLECPASRT